MTSAYDTTVTVRSSGQVEVNGILVAEVCGPARTGGVEVEGRDTLAASLTLDRIARILLETIQETVWALRVSGEARAAANAGWKHRRSDKDPKFVCATTAKDGDDVVDGLVDGLLDVTVAYAPLNGTGPLDGIAPVEPRQDPAYLRGYTLGRHLRRMTAHLERAL